MDCVVSGVMETSSISFDYSWSARKKRTLKPDKSKGFNSISREEEEDCGTRSFSRKRKRSSADNDAAGKTNPKRRRACSKAVPEATSDEKEQLSEDDDDCTLQDWLKELQRRREDKRREELGAKSKMKPVTDMKGEHSEDDDDCCAMLAYSTPETTSKRRNRRKVEFEEDREWNEELELISKMKTTSRTKSRSLGCAAAGKRREELEAKSKIKLLSDIKGEHSEDDDDCCAMLAYSTPETASKRRNRRKVELEEDREWEEELELISKIKATPRTRSRNLGSAAAGSGSNSSENVTDVSRSRSRSPASEVSDSLLKNGISIDSTSMKNTSKESKGGRAICHQCLKGERITLLVCSECEETMYCLQCIRKWYRHLSQDDVIDKCPVCRKNCNCSRCLHLNGLIETSKRELASCERRRHLQYVIALMLPFLNKLSNAQKQEIEFEAKLRGLLPSELDPTRAESHCEERVYCDHCATSIVDLHRSCPKCSYELCLNCCQEIREGSLSERPEMEFQYVDKGYRYMHGLDAEPSSSSVCDDKEANPSAKWQAGFDGSITCAPKELGGCGDCILELKRILPPMYMPGLEQKAETFLGSYDISSRVLNCRCSALETDMTRKAASRASSSDNYLFCPESLDVLNEEELLHFQEHWAKGEPVIVRNALDNTPGLSWEPMVMWRALCENVDSPTASSSMSEVKAIDCLANCETYSGGDQYSSLL